MNLSLFKNYLSLVGAETFNKLIVFAAFVFAARMLGPAYYGYVEWSAAVLMCVGLLVDQGLNSYGAREIARDPSQTRRLVTEVVTVRFLIAAIGYVGIVILALGFIKEVVIAELLLTFGLSLLFLPVLLQWVFQGHDRMHIVAITQIARHLTWAFIIFTFLRTSDDLLVVAIAEVTAVGVAALLSVWFYRRIFGPQLSLHPRLSGKLFRDALPIGLSQMFWVVKMFGATLIVGLIANAEETGYFASAMRILIGLHAFVWLYYLNLLPSLSRAWGQGREGFSGLIRNSMRFIVFVSLLGGIGWVLLAPIVLTLAYGQRFAGGIGALQWLAGVCVAAAVSGHFRFGLIAAGYQGKEMITAAVGAIAAVVFIPIGYFFFGVTGAGAALCFAEVVVLVLTWSIAKRLLFSETTESVKTDNYGEILPGATQ
ncbi:MAG: oligosaccharide flippase family protein [Pyrinomonadaceae bacterium]